MSPTPAVSNEVSYAFAWSLVLTRHFPKKVIGFLAPSITGTKNKNTETILFDQNWRTTIVPNYNSQSWGNFSTYTSCAQPNMPWNELISKAIAEECHIDGHSCYHAMIYQIKIGWSWHFSALFRFLFCNFTEFDYLNLILTCAEIILNTSREILVFSKKLFFLYKY